MQGDTILYLHMIESDSCQYAKLAGIRRYAAARGWRVEAYGRFRSRARRVPGILERERPVGCIVEGAGRWDDLPPALFGATPVVYVDVVNGPCGDCPRILLDPELVAREALRELSAGLPSAYAAVGFVRPHEWSDLRLRAFQKLVEETGKECRVLTARRGEGVEPYIARIGAWVRTLPKGCAVFAVQGPTARNVIAAARAAGLSFPRDLTILCTIGMEKGSIPAPEDISLVQFDFERVGFLAARMLDEWMHGRRAPGSVERLGPLFTVRKGSTRGRGRREPRILDAVAMIRREACDGLSAGALTARFPGTRRLFDMRFREAMGHPPLDEIIHVRLERVLELLAQPNFPISAIADFSGFSSARELQKLFRLRFKTSMRDWRKARK